MGEEINVVNREEWDKEISKNSLDTYSLACYYGAICVIEEIESKIPGSEIQEEIMSKIVKLDSLPDLGYTGFQIGAIASIVYKHSHYGDLFKKYWNKDFGLDEDAKITANPAILVVST